MVLRVAVTLAAWVLLITYAHKLGHQYLGSIKTTFETPVSQTALQIPIIAGLIYLILLSLPGIPIPSRRGVFILLAWATLLAVGHHLSHAGFHELQAILSSEAKELGMLPLLLAACFYLIVLSLPFVPALEFGILIMALFGFVGIVAAYVATVGGLTLAFSIAKLLPETIREKWTAKMGFGMTGADPEIAMKSLLSRKDERKGLSHKIRKSLIEHRYLMLATCLNLPGNSALGGGGGIAFICGASGMFGLGRFFITISLATAPIPLMVSFGIFELEPLLEKHGILHELLSYFEGFLSH